MHIFSTDIKSAFLKNIRSAVLTGKNISGLTINILVLDKDQISPRLYMKISLFEFLKRKRSYNDAEKLCFSNKSSIGEKKTIG